jgi:hypothetical protein
VADQEGAATKPRKIRGKPFAPGNRANPSGRPRRGESLAEAVRSKWPAAKIVEVMTKHAKSKDPGVSSRATEWLADRGYGKAPQAVDLTVQQVEEAAPVDWGAVPLERQKALIGALKIADEVALPGDGDGEKAPS